MKIRMIVRVWRVYVMKLMDNPAAKAIVMTRRAQIRVKNGMKKVAVVN
jgi:hypothetical protein